MVLGGVRPSAQGHERVVSEAVVVSFSRTRLEPAADLPVYFRKMVGNDQRDKRSRDNERYRKGLPGYHDPTAGVGGAAPASSALTLRLYLAIFGLVTCAALAIWLYAINAPTGFVVVLIVLAATAVIDIAAVVRRKRRGEPG